MAHSPRRPRPQGRPLCFLLAIGVVALTTAVRFAADPVLHSQLPYMFYVGAIVVTTWLCGLEAGILGTVVAAFTANYFFAKPRYEFIPHQADWLAMGTFSIVALTAATFVGRSMRAERDVRELHAGTSALLAQMHAATLAADVGVWTWMPGTNQVSVGANWRALFGASPDGNITFETWVRTIHPDDRDRAVDTLKAAWGGRREFSSEYRVVHQDGSVRWIVDRGRPFQDAAGNDAGMAGVNVDITERKTAEEALQHANQMKEEFLATLSHELRTPLNAIVGWSDMLRAGNLSASLAARAAQSIYRNAKLQNELINDVLDVSRIVSGKVRIDTRPLDLAALVDAALESVRPAADAKGVTIFAALGAIGVPAVGDATRLQQVFWNLLSNAVKFTPPGGHVRVSLGTVNGLVQLRVADTGIGIAPDFLPHVFDRFRQHDSSTTRRHGGLGLGLAIVRHLVELHGGSVSAESAGEDLGATFTVTLPAQLAEERRHGGPTTLRRVVPAVEPPLDDGPNLCGVRVMVVDDEADARDMTASVLRHHGATVTVAAKATDALAAFDGFDPDVLLLDLAMPDVDGYALIGQIRQSCGQKGALVPAIALTAYARAEDERRTLASGFQLHLAKPVDSRTLVRSVVRVRRTDAENHVP